MKARFLCIPLVALILLSAAPPSTVFITKTGHVEFISEAPLETIEAANDMVGAVLDIEKKTMAFKVPIVGFEGFNSALQREHFNENYMEVDQFPQATFVGKIIEDIDLSKPGKHRVRAKGMLTIHGVEKERIIPGNVTVQAQGIQIKTDFIVPLSDHDIEIPNIVNQKIAEEIAVKLDVVLKAKA